MLDLRNTPKPRNYLGRREQRRLLLLVMTLGLVVILMSEARKPHNWAWLTELGAEDHFAKTKDDAAADQPPGPVDTRFRPPRRDAGPADAFVAVAAKPPSNENTQASTLEYLPGLNVEALDKVQDDSTFRGVEREAWFNMFDLLKKTDPATVQKYCIGSVSYAQLYKQSADYRGDLIELAGTIRRAVKIPAPKNEVDIAEYYQMVLQPSDDRRSMIMVYCLEIPQGFPTGMDVAAEVKLTGFFFKRWVYRAQDGLRTTPVVLTKTVQWQKAPPAPAEQAPTDPTSLAILIGGALFLSVLVAVFIYQQTRPAIEETPEELPNADALAEVVEDLKQSASDDY